MSVTIQQAAVNAAVAHLKSQVSNDIKIMGRWPNSEFPGRSVTLITAGTRRDTALYPTLVKSTNISTNKSKSTWQVGQCIQPLQMDIWATSWDERDDAMAQIDNAIRAGFNSLKVPPPSADPVALGFWVDIGDGWEDSDSKAYFTFESPDVEDNPTALNRRQYRATYTGDAHMNLVVYATTARLTTPTLTGTIT